MKSRRHIATFLALILLSSLSPFAAKDAEARLPIAEIDTALNAGFALNQASVPTQNRLQDTIMKILNGIAIKIAQEMASRIVDSTISWANSGFEGNPAYVRDPGKYLGNIAEGVAGEYIQGSDLGFLCSPFQDAVKISLVNYYFQPQQRQYQCTLSQVSDNIEGFIDGNFSEGGWDSWFMLTQVPTNNPYGAYMKARIDIDQRVASRLGIEQQKLNWGEGFLSWGECIKWEEVEDPKTGQKKRGTCLQRGPIKTPGSIIKSQLDKHLPNEAKQLVDVQKFDELINALLTGVVKKYVLGSGGGLYDYKRGEAQKGSGGDVLDGVEVPGLSCEDLGTCPEGSPGADPRKIVAVCKALVASTRLSDSRGLRLALGEWEAEISGGSGKYSRIDWDSADDFENEARQQPMKILSSTASSTKVVQAYLYEKEGTKTAKITVIDADPTIPPLVDNSCSGSIYVYK